MTEQKTIGQVLGLKKGKVPMAPVTEEQMHDEVVRQAIGITAQMREEIRHWRERAESAERHLEVEHRDNARLSEQIKQFKHDHERETATLRFEHERLNTIIAHLEGMFNASAKVILEAMDTVKRERNPEPAAAYKPDVDAVRSVARALTPEQENNDDGKPIPDYLRKPIPVARDAP